jgi:dipeptidyl aminopeptidase/acylaminoacyl peptidase
MRSLRPIALLTFLGGVVSPPYAADAPAKSFQLEDLRRLVTIDGVALSPDGRQVAVVVLTPDWDRDEAKQEIDLVDVATGARRALTQQRKGQGLLAWAPDGHALAFLAEAQDEPVTDLAAPAAPGASQALPSAAVEDGAEKKGDKHPQVFVMPMSGGDALRVTHAPRGVDGFSWSPDGRRIAYVAPDEPVNASAIARHDDAFQVTDNHFLARAALTPSHLWVVAVEGGSAQRLTGGSFSLQTDQRDDAPLPAWSADGRRVAFARFPNPYWGPSFQSVIGGVDATGGDSSTVAAAAGATTAAYAGDSGLLAYLRPRDGDQNNGNAVYVVQEGVARDATAGLARNVDAYAWLPGGRSLLLEGIEGTRAALWVQPLDRPARRLELGDVMPEGKPSIAHTGAIAFVGSTPTHPGELYILDAPNGTPRRLTNLNAFVDTLTLGRTRSVEWQGPDGRAEDGALTYPVRFEPGKRYPLVLVIHGGPQASSTTRFEPLSQLLAKEGFLVFSPNYRGSTNLGDAYQHAIYRDTGAGPGEDVMAGLAAVKKLGFVDTDRIGVSGWSYGGYMTTWLTSHYPGWKAAVAGAALTDWVMDYTIAYYQAGDLAFFGGSPWSAADRDLWRQQSPIAHAGHVTAPTLVMGDVGDPNVPLVNSYEWYHALRDNGVQVEFWAYPVDTHFPEDIVRATDVHRRWVAWMVEHLK